MIVDMDIVTLVLIATVLAVIAALAVALVALARRARDAEAAVSAALADPGAPALDEAALLRLMAEERAVFEKRTTETMTAALEQLGSANRALIGDGRAAAKEELDGKKQLIDAQLAGVNERMQAVTDLVTKLEGERKQEFGALTEAISAQQAGIAGLNTTTRQLREALSSTKTRGQWGERMAEDVLNLAGFVRDVNYRRNKSLEGGSGIPDYTFLMPQESILYMDVKFPLDNYLKYLETEDELEQRRCRDAFLTDVRGHIKALAGRGYADGDGVVDCVLLFIPNEALYAFVQEHDSSILDDALRRSIVMCSPLTLFAVLAVLRQSIESFHVERTAHEILGLLGELDKQWDKYVGSMSKLGRAIDSVRRDYDDLTGTRQRGVEKVLRKVDGLRASQPELLPVDDDGDEPDAPRAIGG